MRHEDEHAIAAGHPAQCAALTTLVNRIYAASEGDIWLAGAAFERTSEAEMERLLRAEEILVGTRGGAVVGCIRWHVADSEQRVGEFGMLCVDEESRHVGLGSRLVHAAELAATAAGCRMIECELLVPRDGPHAAKDQMRSWCARTSRTYHPAPMRAPMLRVQILLFRVVRTSVLLTE